ncbi:MAG: hypothetical protein M1821_008831 [Bathelium mastoideum]|nr:MAG: hypothetical protein M1821_008831 [Bathelium mastoideum]KAI9687592.1 MAG: hypothetical protein M1822_002202 [Bathelium mastoideum]
MAHSGARVDRPANKKRRESFHLKFKKERAAKKRELQFRRKKEENRDPALRQQRRSRNQPATIDRKRVWDEVDEQDDRNVLGKAIDTSRLKRRRTSDELGKWVEESDTDFEGLSGTDKEVADDGTEEEDEEDEDEADSMLDSNSEDGSELELSTQAQETDTTSRTMDQDSSSTATDMNLAPDVFLSKFPTLYEPPQEPKVLITTSFRSTLHYEANVLTTLFGNAKYVPRNKHRFSHDYSIREIASFAVNRGYTSLIILNELQKRPCGLDIVHLPAGPMFHFSISNWVLGDKLPGHGNPTNHYPELILNNFLTPLGLLTAHLFRTLFPSQADLEGRQVVTLHNQRDYIFVRRHRYVFRDRRDTEKKIIGRDGREVKAVEGIRAGLQELGPRFTLKLRRVDRGIQRSSGQEWEWQAGSEKKRTRFQL